jgi:prepilin-type N-terminal cleavage/methylation domain-containing protein
MKAMAAWGWAAWPPAAAQRGFSLVEMAFALVVSGLLSWAAFTSFETVSAQRDLERGRAEAQKAQSILRAFALRHGRLPCPDAGTTATGYESLSAGTCAVGVQLGWFPYVSVGLEMPEPRHLARYAVFRASNVDPVRDADLAVAKERTRDDVGDSLYLDVTDLIAALANAASVPLSNARAHLTGDGGAAGAVNCASNVVMAAAYWIVVPLQDKDNDGSRLDPPHGAASLCAASPSAPPNLNSDDVVVAESPAQLAGWLRKSLP